MRQKIEVNMECKCRCGGTRTIGPTSFTENFKIIGRVDFLDIMCDVCDTCDSFRIKDAEKYDKTVKEHKHKNSLIF